MRGRGRVVGAVGITRRPWPAPTNGSPLGDHGTGVSVSLGDTGTRRRVGMQVAGTNGPTPNRQSLWPSDSVRYRWFPRIGALAVVAMTRSEPSELLT